MFDHIRRGAGCGRAGIRSLVGLGAAALLGVHNAPAVAEESSGSMIEEIVVTAQKREESINEVGMSVQAATGEHLFDLGITETSQL